MRTLLAVFALLTAVPTVSTAAPYVGASAGYLVDAKEDFLSARVGWAVFNDQRLTHALELEVGRYHEDYLGNVMQLVPVMANYRLTTTLSDRVGLYLGAGAGVALVEVRLRYWLEGRYHTVTDDDTTFAAQAFVGTQIRVTDRLTALVGARYLRVNDIKLWGRLDLEMGHDVALEAGVTWRF
jgi:opacity protein-like surface antigen